MTSTIVAVSHWKDVFRRHFVKVPGITCWLVLAHGPSSHAQRTDRPATLTETTRIGPPSAFGTIADVTLGPDSSLFLIDSRAPSVRKYTFDGRVAMTYGAVGDGPGQYRAPSAVVRLDSGRLAVYDPTNLRVLIFDVATGRARDTWEVPGLRLRGGAYRMIAARDGGVFVETRLAMHSEPRPRVDEYAYLYLSRLGKVIDTVHVPKVEYSRFVAWKDVPRPNGPPAYVMATVPFAPRPRWAMHPDGFQVSTSSKDYSVDLIGPRGTVKRIAASVPEVPVLPGERDAWSRFLEESFVNNPGGTIQGPEIPQTKPAINKIMVGTDGTIWLRLSTTARLMGAAMDHTAWQEPEVYDVLDARGERLGTVSIPEQGRLLSATRWRIIYAIMEPGGRSTLFVANLQR